MLVGHVGSFGHGHVAEYPLDPLCHGVRLVQVLQLYLVVRHLVRFFEDGLSVGQRDDGSTVLENLPGFVDAGDSEQGVVQRDGVTDRFVKVVGCLVAQQNLFLAHQGLPLDDLEMFDGHLFRIVAADNEVWNTFHLDDVEDDARNVAHVGHL